jgi:hypothetical protein
VGNKKHDLDFGFKVLTAVTVFWVATPVSSEEYIASNFRVEE